MRISMTLLATGAIFVATPAFAQDGGWYVGGQFGGLLVGDADFEINDIEDAVSVEHDLGYEAGVFVGYDLGSFRIQAEVAYRNAGVDEIDTSIGLPGGIPPGEHPVEQGGVDSLSFMVDGIYEIGDGRGLTPFVGAGLGMTTVDLNDVRVLETAPPFLDDDDSAFAWQLIAGLSWEATDRLNVDVTYRYLNADGLEFDDGFDRGHGSYDAMSVVFGLVYSLRSQGD